MQRTAATASSSQAKAGLPERIFDPCLAWSNLRVFLSSLLLCLVTAFAHAMINFVRAILRAWLLPAIFLVALAGVIPSASAAGFTFLHAGNFMCPQEYARMLEHILDAETPKERDAMVIAAVFSGSCTGASAVAIEIADVEHRRSPKGNGYSCFHLYDEKGPMNCALNQYVTDIETEIAQRSGDYRILGEGPGGIKVSCLEGGTVSMQKTSGGWERFSMIFPKQMELPTAVSTDRETALREGCRGFDYR
jgi:hypothetical protein